ncbi:unnamed protein product [Mytilus coruscus]|uniref:Uncharacterized protein n=1 Tax=Mytilus coruscus TaxID=42192 RepID=A0A6J8E3G5_MYTCO|nr:unnamed protein product [Mytilus coruscus]
MKIVHVDHLKRVEGDGIENQLLNVDSSFKTLFESESQESNDTEIEPIDTFLVTDILWLDADVLDYDEEEMDQEISVMNQGGDMNESDKATCKRRHDIKTHLSRIHGIHDKLTLETSVAKINKVVQDNRGFIDPGFWIYKNRMDQPATPTTSASTIICTSSTPTVSRTPACVLSPVTSAPVLSTMSASLSVSTLPSCPASAPTPSASLVASSLANTADDSDGPQFTVSIPARKPATTITLEEYRQRPHSASSDTSLLSSRSLDTSLGILPLLFNLPVLRPPARFTPFVVPPIPKGEEELEEYVAYLCNAIDCIGRTRKVAKDRLESIRKEGTRLERERQERRTVEAENRRLRTQLAELKSRDNLFPGYGTITLKISCAILSIRVV